MHPPARGLGIEGAWITGKLDLAGEALPVPLGLIHCTLEEDIVLRDCTLPALYMPGTHLPKLNAQRLQCNGSLHLSDGFQATGLVDLVGAEIDGQLSCNGGKFLAERKALNCSAVTVGSDVVLSGEFDARRRIFLNRFEARGRIDLNRAEIAENLQISGATLNTG